MSSVIIYKNKDLLKCGISLLSNLSDRMFDIALNAGHLDSEPLIIFISSMQTSWYYSLDRFSTEGVKLFAKLAIQSINELIQEGYFDLSPEAIQDRLAKKISLDIPRGDKTQALEFKQRLEEIIKELEAA